jgi:hypothetical protein
MVRFVIVIATAMALKIAVTAIAALGLRRRPPLFFKTPNILLLQLSRQSLCSDLFLDEGVPIKRLLPIKA